MFCHEKSFTKFCQFSLCYNSPIHSFTLPSLSPTWDACHFNCGWGNSLHLGLPTSLCSSFYSTRGIFLKYVFFFMRFLTEKHSVALLTWHLKTTTFPDFTSASQVFSCFSLKQCVRTVYSKHKHFSCFQVFLPVWHPPSLLAFLPTYPKGQLKLCLKAFLIPDLAKSKFILAATVVNHSVLSIQITTRHYFYYLHLNKIHIS